MVPEMNFFIFHYFRHDGDSAILPLKDEIKATCPLPQTVHLEAILKVVSFKIIVETFTGLELVGMEETNRTIPLRKVYLVFSACDAVIIGRIPPFHPAFCAKKETGKRKKQQEETNNESPCRLVFHVKRQELPVVHSKKSSHYLVSSVYGHVLQTTHASASDSGSKQKQEGILKFANNCYWLDMIHSGRIYSIIEDDHVGDNCCHLKDAFPFINISSKVKLEEVDASEYKDCLTDEECLKIRSVRSYLTMWETINLNNKTE
jgi:hypothetical protein